MERMDETQRFSADYGGREWHVRMLEMKFTGKKGGLVEKHNSYYTTIPGTFAVAFTDERPCWWK